MSAAIARHGHNIVAYRGSWDEGAGAFVMEYELEGGWGGGGRRRVCLLGNSRGGSCRLPAAAAVVRSTDNPFPFPRAGRPDLRQAMCSELSGVPGVTSWSLGSDAAQQGRQQQQQQEA